MKYIIFSILLAITQALPQEVPNELPSPKKAADEGMFGEKLARTMTDLATSNPGKRNPVKVLFYGQSITAQPWSSAIAARLHKQYPDADFQFENRAIGGFEADQLMLTARQDLYPFYPDLVIFQVYGGGKGELETIISNIRRQTTAEILIATHHVSHVGNGWILSEYDKQSQLIRDLAKKYDCELADVREDWKQYLTDNQLQPQELLQDLVHLNEKGCRLMEALIWRHLRYNKDFANPHADWIKSVPVHPAADGSIKVAFTGNRVDLVAAAADKPPGTAQILIDGKPPSSNPGAYAFTRPSKAQDVWYPALRTVRSQTTLLVEDWTLKLTGISDDSKQFQFAVTGSKTGPDGEGNSAEKFVSKSGRVVIDPADFCLAAAQTQTKKPCPPDFEIKWSVVPMFQDTYTPPKASDPASPVRTTVVQLIENGPHTLEIVPNGKGVIPLKEIQIFRPPAGKDTL